jgi:hypothetical protein
MRKVIAAVLILLAAWGGWELYLYWGTYRDRDPDLNRGSGGSAGGPLGEVGGVMDIQADLASGGSASSGGGPVVVSSSALEGMPRELDPLLAAAQKQGAAGLRQFLKDYGKLIKDPRLAMIQLDFVVQVALTDPAEARRVFAEVKKRTPVSSPVHARVKSLEKTYQ